MHNCPGQREAAKDSRPVARPCGYAAAVTRRIPFLLAGLLLIIVRLPFLGVPLDADEGGYAYLSRQWAAGGRLYGPVWVDRPQGLMLLYRLISGLDRAKLAVHLGAIAVALVLLIGVAAAAGALAGRRAAVIAAFLIAVLGAAPRLQGFMLNGELAAGAFSALAVAFALWFRRTDRLMLLAAAGATGALAVLMKQSGFDGLLVALAVAVLAHRLSAVLAYIGGVIVPLGLALLQAALTSWSDWWFAIVGYRLHTSAGSRGGLSGRWHNITADLAHLWPELVPLAALAVLGLAWCVRNRSWVPLVWMGCSLVGFGGGVFFFPHYWIQLVGPACLLGAPALATLPRRITIALTIAACLPVVLFVGRMSISSSDQRDRLAVPDGRLLANRDIAPWLRAHAAPNDQLYAFVSSADLYYSTGLHTDFRYLWQANLDAIPGSVVLLGNYLAGSDHPSWVVLYAQPGRIDPSGRIGGTLSHNFHQVDVIDGVRILHSS